MWLDHSPLSRFLSEHKIRIQWSDAGERIPTHDKNIPVGSVEMITSGPKISTRSQVDLLAKTLAMSNAKAAKTKIDEECPYDFQFNDLLGDEHPKLICILLLHKTKSIFSYQHTGHDC